MLTAGQVRASNTVKKKRMLGQWTVGMGSYKRRFAATFTGL